MWAILSGIEGNLKAYEAVLDDIKRQRVRVEELYILGDLVGINPDCDKLVERLQKPRQGELLPQVCTGWWEEQCFILHAIGATSEPTLGFCLTQICRMAEVFEFWFSRT